MPQPDLNHKRLRQEITDICMENGYVTLPMVNQLEALFEEQKERAVRENLNYILNNASGGGNWRRLVVQELGRIDQLNQLKSNSKGDGEWKEPQPETYNGPFPETTVDMPRPKKGRDE